MGNQEQHGVHVTCCALLDVPPVFPEVALESAVAQLAGKIPLSVLDMSESR